MFIVHSKWPSRVTCVLTYALNNNVQRRLRVTKTQSLYVCTHHRLSFSLLDSQFTTVVATGRANGVVDVKSATVRACSQCRSFHYVMGTTFRLSGVRLSSFRMCHIARRFRRAICSAPPRRGEGLIIVQCFILYLRQYRFRDPARHKGDHGGEVPFADCTHPVGDCERAEY